MSREAVEEKLGPADAATRMEDGTTRLVYSMQPMSQQVWWLRSTRPGTSSGRRRFSTARTSPSSSRASRPKKDVYALFGDCAQKYVFHLSDQTAWMYRFLDDGVFHMACWVQFDMQGVVTEVGYTTDPWHDRDSGWFF